MDHILQYHLFFPFPLSPVCVLSAVFSMMFARLPITSAGVAEQLHSNTGQFISVQVPRQQRNSSSVGVTACYDYCCCGV